MAGGTDLPVKTTLVQSWEELEHKPGAYVITEQADGKKGFIISCPKCGIYASSSSGHTVEVEEPLTVSPSFICPHKPCDAHYFVKNGEIQLL